MPWLLVVGLLALSGMGVAFVASAHSSALALRHAEFAALGCLVFGGLTLLDYRHLSDLAVPLYALGLVSLVGLWSPLGTVVNGARRWYDLGIVRAQPSEPMKIILVLALAECYRVSGQATRPGALVTGGFVAAVPMALVAMQPDFGSALMLLPVFVGMAFLGGVRLRHLTALVACGVVLGAAVWFAPGVLKPYQKARVLAFVQPASSAGSRASYNSAQAALAISAGGAMGQGWGRGILNRLGRVPERHTDFIFPVVAEEWGFARTSVLVLLYLGLVLRLGAVAATAQDPFGRLVAAGVLISFATQSFVHMAISLRLAPVTGLTLPLVSYGGSSLVTTFAAFGIVTSVQVHQHMEFSATPARG
jgi:rod shape determining protein RodA